MPTLAELVKKAAAAQQAPTMPRHNAGSQALTHWLDAQLAAHDLGELVDQVWAVEQRLEAGDAWLRAHDDDEPAVPAARRLWNRLLSESHRLRGEAEWQYQLSWSECCMTYSCLAAAREPPAELAHLDATSPFTLWPALETGLPARNYPLDVRDRDIYPRPPHVRRFRREEQFACI